MSPPDMGPQCVLPIMYLSNWLCPEAAHWSVICQAVEGHVRRSLSSGWSLPHLKDPHDPDMSMQVRGQATWQDSLQRDRCSNVGFVCFCLSLSYVSVTWTNIFFLSWVSCSIGASTQEGSRNKKTRAGHPVILYHKVLAFWTLRMMPNARERQASNACVTFPPPLKYHPTVLPLQVENLVPYWLSRGEAVPNSFDFRGLFLLTAPNMSGKSTLMRSVLACSLLANAGLFVPCTSAAVPRYVDHDMFDIAKCRRDS